jgi:hypothetical protein
VWSRCTAAIRATEPAAIAVCPATRRFASAYARSARSRAALPAVLPAASGPPVSAIDAVSPVRPGCSRRHATLGPPANQPQWRRGIRPRRAPACRVTWVRQPCFADGGRAARRLGMSSLGAFRTVMAFVACGLLDGAAARADRDASALYAGDCVDAVAAVQPADPHRRRTDRGSTVARRLPAVGRTSRRQPPSALAPIAPARQR